ncbi:MAG TPA: DsbA family protein [Solirubrobacteraceae bacterium]|nr:DsbA family protein [Solirubrobacteraceae bacterium]
MSIDVLHMSDPACPWAYSASPALAVLRWRFGDQLAWRLSMIGLSESADAYAARGYTATRQAAGRLSFRRFGMPFGLDVRERMQATGRACRAVVATRLAHPGRELAVFRALQWGHMTTTLLMDTDEGIAAAIADVPGIDAAAVVAALDSPEVSEAYEADRARARSAAGSPCEAMGRTATSDGQVRYTAPSLVFTAPDGRTLDAGGFQPLEVYDAALANLDPTLARRDEPSDPVEALADFPDGLTTAEVTALMTPRNSAPDRTAAERALIEAVGAGRATRRALGDDALWLAA